MIYDSVHVSVFYRRRHTLFQLIYREIARFCDNFLAFQSPPSTLLGNSLRLRLYSLYPFATLFSSNHQLSPFLQTMQKHLYMWSI